MMATPSSGVTPVKATSAGFGEGWCTRWHNTGTEIFAVLLAIAVELDLCGQRCLLCSFKGSLAQRVVFYGHISAVWHGPLG